MRSYVAQRLFPGLIVTIICVISVVIIINYNIKPQTFIRFILGAKHT